MKQRITYLVKEPDSFTPEKLQVEDSSFSLRSIEAVKEHRLTFSLDELPSELRKALKQWQELHIKWASLKPYTTVPPFTSRVTPGLHVFFEPHKTQPEGQLCDLLHSAFGPELKCSPGPDAEKAATSIFYSSEDSRPDATAQYYSYLPTLAQLVSYIEKSICPSSSKICKKNAQSLLDASYFDIDYSTSSSNLILTAFWDSPTEGWNELIPAPSSRHSTEVGVLTHEPNPDPEDIAFGGFLTVLGRDTAPKPTRFQSPTRHYPLPSKELTYSTSFASPTGLHPTLTLTFPSALLTPPNPTCELHAHLTLPSYLFIDKYQFTDALFLSTHNLVALRHLSGATDLEAPDWVIPQWGSTSLFALASPSTEAKGQTGKQGGDWNVTIPLHLRYLPATASSHTRVPVPWPVVFWACADAEQDGAGNPFDRRNLGYEGAFGEGVRFMHVPPSGSGNGTGDLVSWIDVPVLDTRAAGWVETGTIGVVVLAFLGLCWVLFGGAGGKKGAEMKDKKKQ